MSFAVSPLPGNVRFGAVVTGLAEDRLDDPETREALRRLWIDKGLLVFRGIGGGGISSAETHMRLARAMGTPGEHPMQRRPGAPDEGKPTYVMFDRDKGSDLYEVDGALWGGYQPWHVDWIYMDEIARGGMMAPVTLPGSGGDTGFIDQIEAYEALPDRLKAKAEQLNVLYAFHYDASKTPFGKRPERCLNLSDRIVQAARHERVARRSIHPMVFRQPETGRKVLNISPWWADGIEGMENAEGRALLDELIEHGTDPALAYWHRWQPSDILLWDNWRLLHAAQGVPVGEVRHMHRIDLVGDYGMGRYEAP
jgi:taurine dioxygenase